MHFFLPLLASHDRARFHVSCYPVATLRDASTEAMQARADRWVDCAALDDDALAALIRNDDIDILVDLVGHCPGNRLGVFARRAAPIQVTWMDYVDTTGLSTMDFILTDEGHTPTDGSQLFSEKVMRLPDTRLCYRPIDDLPPLVPPPQVERGQVTFGCFNRLSKLGPDVISAWSTILASIERSRLVLKSTAFAAEATRVTVASRFAAHGIDPARLDLRPFSAERAMLRDYGEVDVALDPFPYNGCTTTCDALAMGVPVVTLEGRTLPGRHGVALLAACDLHEWIAHSRDEYLALAQRAAADVVQLTHLRRTLRQRFLASPLCDAPRFARRVEAAYTAMLEQGCRQTGRSAEGLR